MKTFFHFLSSLLIAYLIPSHWAHGQKFVPKSLYDTFKDSTARLPEGHLYYLLISGSYQPKLGNYITVSVDGKSVFEKNVEAKKDTSLATGRVPRFSYNLNVPFYSSRQKSKIAIRINKYKNTYETFSEKELFIQIIQMHSVTPKDYATESEKDYIYYSIKVGTPSKEQFYRIITSEE